jgi:hypothetical protein
MITTTDRTHTPLQIADELDHLGADNLARLAVLERLFWLLAANDAYDNNQFVDFGTGRNEAFWHGLPQLAKAAAEATEEMRTPVLTLAAGRHHTAEAILRAWFQGKAAHTIRAYRHDPEDFALFLSRSLAISPPLDVERAAAILFKQSSPSVHELVLAFRHHLESAHLSAASINRHSRHRTIATLMIYVDEHDRQQTQKTLDDLVADTLTSA